MIDRNDIRLTSFVLGELDANEQAIVEQAIASSPELKLAVEDIRQTVSLLDAEFAEEGHIGLHNSQKAIFTADSDTTLDTDVVQRATSPARSNTTSRKSLFLNYWGWAAAAACLAALAIPLMQSANQTRLDTGLMQAKSDPAAVGEPASEPMPFDGGGFESRLNQLADNTDKTELEERFDDNLSLIISNTQVIQDDDVETKLSEDESNQADSFGQPLSFGLVTQEAEIGSVDDFLATDVDFTDSPNAEPATDAMRMRRLSVADGFDRPQTPFSVNESVRDESVAAPADKWDEFESKARDLGTNPDEERREYRYWESAGRNLGELAVESVELVTELGQLESETKPTVRFKEAAESDGATRLSLEQIRQTRLFSQPVVDEAAPMRLNRIAVKEGDLASNVDEITERVEEELRKAVAGQPASVKAKAASRAKVNRAKTWRRVKAIPNTSRLMIGDKDELDMNGMQVHVQIDGFRARVLVDCFYYNDRNQQLEGKFKIRLPDDASLYYFAFGQSAYDLTPDGDLTHHEFVHPSDGTRFVSLRANEVRKQRGDVWRNVKEARIVPREKAAFAYSQTVRRKVDPALVEWSGAGVFNANVFPLMPQKLHRIVIGYDVNLTETQDGLAYELNVPEQVGQCKIDLDVSNIGDAEVTVSADAESNASVENIKTNRGTRYRIDQPKPGSQIRLNVAGSKNVMLRSRDEKEGDFFAARVKLELPSEDVASNSRAIFLVDTSLSSRPDKFNVWLDLLQATLNNNRDSMKEFAVQFFNVENHYWQPQYVANTRANVRQLVNNCQQLALEGATDVYSAMQSISTTAWITKDGAPDVFLLSDGATNWGETNLRLIQQEIANAGVGSLFAYQTGMSGTAIANLRFLATQSGGAVFSVANEDEVASASTAHRARPWRLKSIRCDGASDLLTAGRLEWVYPGQSVTVVGRLNDGNDPADMDFVLQRGDELKTISVRSPSLIESELANRLYGQVATGQLESLGHANFDVSTAYARHFRITGQTCSLLMLESEADYQRFDIKPQDDLFVVKTTSADQLVVTTLAERANELSDPKAQLLAWLARLEKMPGMEFTIPTALKLALDQIEVYAISDPLHCEQNNIDDLSKEYVNQLSSNRLDYEAVIKEAESRGEESSDEAIKVLSSLIEQNTGDLVLARDVAFVAMEMSRPAQAYHLLRSIANARPYDPSIYTALGQCLTQLNKLDMAIVFYEIALGAKFQNRGADYQKIAATEYAYLLRMMESDRKDSKIKSYASARLDSINEKYRVEDSADLLITMQWNTDQTDVDLHVVEPSGEECFYSHPKTRAGGQITRDITDGFGPEMYTIKKAPNGEYDLLVKYFSTNANRAGMRSKVYLTIYRDFGTGSESVVRKVVNITKPGQKELVEKLIVK